MKNYAKLLSLVLCIATVVACLGSCFLIPEQKDEYQDDVYAASVTVKFATNSDEIRDAIDSMRESTSTVYVDHDKIRVETGTEINNIYLTNNYVFVDSVLYRENRLTVGDKATVVLNKADVSDADCDNLLSKIGVGASIDPEDFELSDKIGTDGNYSYSCNTIKEDAKASLEAIYASKFSGLDATVVLTDAELVLEVEHDRTKSSILSCHFEIEMNGNSYDVTMHIYTDYDYDAMFELKAPSNADSYNKVGYDEIFE